MTLYSVVLYVHVLSALLLTSALSFESLVLARLRRSASQSQARMWTDLVPGFPFMAVGALLALLFSGGYLTAKMSGWSLGWPRAAVLAVLLFALLGAATARRMRQMRRVLAEEGNGESLALARLNDPFLRFSLHIRGGLFAGTVLLMVAKPDFAESIAILVVAIVLGSASGLTGLRRARVAPSPNSQVGA